MKSNPGFRRGDRHRLRCFTLIELLIVVVIIALLSALAVPSFLKAQERARMRRVQPAQQNMARAAGSTMAEYAPVPMRNRPGKDELIGGSPPPTIDSAQIAIRLKPEIHRVGMDVYSRHEAAYVAELTVRRSPGEINTIALVIPLPGGEIEARDVRLTLTRDGTPPRTWEPEDLIYARDALVWIGDPGPGLLRARAEYTVLGRDRFVLALPDFRRLGELSLTLDVEGAAGWQIPDESLQPTLLEKNRAEWKYGNLITERPIVIDLPASRSPMGRVMLLFRLMAVAVLLFGAGFWYLSELERPGQLSHFRWGHFLLLALTYSLFFVVFAVVSLREGSRPLSAMAISAALSLPLLMLHGSRVLNGRFALTRILPLAIFTLGIVINGVYGDAWRDYVFLGATVGIVALLTLSFRTWTTRRQAWLRQTRADRRSRVDALHQRMAKEVEPAFARAAAAVDRATRMLKTDGLDLTAETRAELGAEIKAFARHETVRKTVNASLSDLSRIVAANDWVPNLDGRMRILERQMRGYEGELADASRALEAHLPAAAVEPAADGDDGGMHHCPACGLRTPHAPYCQHCGTAQPRTVACVQCGEQTTLMVHLIADREKELSVFCRACGRKNLVAAGG